MAAREAVADHPYRIRVRGGSWATTAQLPLLLCTQRRVRDYASHPPQIHSGIYGGRLCYR